jgi:hypothetical protein
MTAVATHSDMDGLGPLARAASAVMATTVRVAVVHSRDLRSEIFLDESAKSNSTDKSNEILLCWLVAHATPLIDITLS